MKRILLALLVALTICSLTNAQSQTVATAAIHSVGESATKTKNAGDTTITVIGEDVADADEDTVDVQTSSSGSMHSGMISMKDTENLLFNQLEKGVDQTFLVSIVAIVFTFGFPVFIIFIIFFFRYKNRKARYRMVEQALASGQPLPADFLKEDKSKDHRSQGIMNIFTGIGLFIFLWAITGRLAIGTIGLLIMFTGLGQWFIGYQKQREEKEAARVASAAQTNKAAATAGVEDINDEKNNEKK